MIRAVQTAGTPTVYCAIACLREMKTRNPSLRALSRSPARSAPSMGFERPPDERRGQVETSGPLVWVTGKGNKGRPAWPAQDFRLRGAEARRR